MFHRRFYWIGTSIQNVRQKSGKMRDRKEAFVDHLTDEWISIYGDVRIKIIELNITQE